MRRSVRRFVISTRRLRELPSGELSLRRVNIRHGPLLGVVAWARASGPDSLLYGSNPSLPQQPSNSSVHPEGPQWSLIDEPGMSLHEGCAGEDSGPSILG